MNKGFTVLIILFIIVISMGLAFFFSVENWALKQIILETTQESGEYAVENDRLKNYVDYNFYYKENSEQKNFYVLENCRVEKLDYAKFIKLRDEYGYKY